MTAVRRLAALVALGALLAGCSSAAAAAPMAEPSSEPAATIVPLRYVIVGAPDFRTEVQAILESPGSWTTGIVVLADNGPVDFYIWLTYPADAPRCGDCSYGNMVAIGTEAWYSGAHKGPGSLDEFVIPAPEWHRFVINHEVGHQLGFPFPHSGSCSVMNPRVCPGEWPIDVDDYLRTQAREWLTSRPPTA